MLIVNHTLKRNDSIGNATYTDNFQLVDTLEEARQAVTQIISLHGDELFCYAISQVIEASEPHWANVKPMGIKD
jgi:selenocysteine lyase/cysteine desulfurase